jgi:hypothetical protein
MLKTGGDQIIRVGTVINFFLRELMQEPKELMQESWQGSGWASWGGSSCCGGKKGGTLSESIAPSSGRHSWAVLIVLTPPPPPPLLPSLCLPPSPPKTDGEEGAS